MANGSSPPGPFPVNPSEVPYIVHSEEFINKCFLSRFRNASPSVASEALSSVKAVLLRVRRAAPSPQRLAAAGAVPGRSGAPPPPPAADRCGEGGRDDAGITEAATTLEPAL